MDATPLPPQTTINGVRFNATTGQRPLRVDGCITISELFQHRCAELGDRTAHREKDLGIWKSYSWTDYWQHAKWIGLALQKLGLKRGEVVSILSEDRKEWAWFDMGIQCVGGISSGIYTTDSANQLQYLVNDSGSKFLIVEDEEHLDKFLEVENQVPDLVKVIILEGEGLHDLTHPRCMMIDDLYALGQQADVVLQLPDAPEACAIGMAPTASTTVTMALGDALAVALMKLRGFEKENFLAFHPGGSLGAQLLPVSALMHSGADLPLVVEDTPMGEALVQISAKGLGIVALTENGKLTGIITDGDLRRNLDGLMSKTAGQVATRNPRTIRAGALASEALGIMNDKKITTLCVTTEDGTLQGILHIHDCLRAGVA